MRVSPRPELPKGALPSKTRVAAKPSKRICHEPPRIEQVLRIERPLDRLLQREIGWGTTPDGQRLFPFGRTVNKNESAIRHRFVDLVNHSANFIKAPLFEAREICPDY